MSYLPEQKRDDTYNVGICVVRCVGKDWRELFACAPGHAWPLVICGVGIEDCILRSEIKPHSFLTFFLL